MVTLAQEIPAINEVRVSKDTLSVSFEDGRSISVPLAWYPRLFYAKDQDRQTFRLIGRGHGITWRELDEDISAKNILFGQPSGESDSSFASWLTHYKNRSA